VFTPWGGEKKEKKGKDCPLKSLEERKE